MLPAPLTSSLQRRKRGEPTGIEGGDNRGDLLVETALGDEHSDQQSLSDGTERVAMADPFDRKPQRRRGADQEDHRDDAAAAARDLATSFAIELAVKERDGTAANTTRWSMWRKIARISPNNPSIARPTTSKSSRPPPRGIITCSDVVRRPEGTNNDRGGGADMRARQPRSGSDLRV
jgi:hypothetical protein